MDALCDLEHDIRSIIWSEADNFKPVSEGTPRSHRPRAPLENATNRVPEHRPPQQDPLTPTANFKLLTSLAATLDYAHSPNEKSLIRKLDLNQMHSKENVTREESENVLPEKLVPSRKNKSLGRLCEKFLSSYPDILSENEKVVISLDEVAKDLGVERRRIYDIVNVLESVEVVTKVGKNTYSWHGKANLTFTLTKLMALAEEENLGVHLRALEEQLRHEEEQEVYPYEEASSVHDEESSASDNSPPESRKEKALAIISQKFLMLFLVSDTKVVNLDLAARAINGVQCDEVKKKTKTRRLYDIANVLQSFGLIQKVFVTRFRGRKPAFRYIGPQLPFQVQSTNSNSAISKIEEASSAEDSLKEISRTLYSKKCKLPRTRSGNLEEKGRSSVKRKGSSLVRHSSLKEICEIAEQERKKFYPDEDQEVDPTSFEGLQHLTDSSRSKSTTIISQPDDLPLNLKTESKERNSPSMQNSPSLPVAKLPPTPLNFYQEAHPVHTARPEAPKPATSPTVYKPNVVNLAVLNSIPKTKYVSFINSTTGANAGGGMLVAPPGNAFQTDWTGLFVAGGGSLTQLNSSNQLFVPIKSQAARLTTTTLVPVPANAGSVVRKVVSAGPATYVRKVIIKKLIVKNIAIAK